MFDTARRVGGYDEFQAQLRELEKRQVSNGMFSYVFQQSIGVFGGVVFVFLGMKLLIHRKTDVTSVLITAGIFAFVTSVSAVFRFRKMRARVAAIDQAPS